ncbi:MAG TPA: glycosyltransferase, partial [Candidatus Acidoferrales bacterium]|nr:glycosyltransferase [Candidatus Acidoferrales bacterium]
MLSVIVPTYNEAGRIEELLSELRAQDPTCDLIVVDGSSMDATVTRAEPYARVVVTQPNRGRQLNLGARAARGDQLLFLHADVRLPPGALAAVQRALSDPEAGGGTFRLKFAGADLASRVFSLIDRWRRWFGIFYGDSGIFVRR